MRVVVVPWVSCAAVSGVVTAAVGAVLFVVVVCRRPVLAVVSC